MSDYYAALTPNILLPLFERFDFHAAAAYCIEFRCVTLTLLAI